MPLNSAHGDRDGGASTEKSNEFASGGPCVFIPALWGAFRSCSKFPALRVGHGQFAKRVEIRVTKCGRQPTIAEDCQARSVVDNDARHWIVGPLIRFSTESSDCLSSEAARTG